MSSNDALSSIDEYLRHREETLNARIAPRLARHDALEKQTTAYSELLPTMTPEQKKVETDRVRADRETLKANEMALQHVCTQICQKYDCVQKKTKKLVVFHPCF